MDSEVSSTEPLRADCESDVLVFLVTNGFSLESERPPIEARINLDEGLWVGQLPRHQSEKIIDACAPSGFNSRYKPHSLSLTELYTFVRENPPSHPQCAWDADDKLKVCVALSRLVHPTSVCLRHTATVKTDSQGEIVRIDPGIVDGPGSFADIAQINSDWLSPADAESLRKLLSAYQHQLLPKQLQTAFWYHEYAAWAREPNARWVFIVTGLEALVHTQRHGNTRQFVTRVPLLANESGCDAITSVEADEMYNLRSEIAHGIAPSLEEAQRPLYCKMENLLRVTLYKAILDPKFGALFVDASQIEKKWPV